MTVSTLEICTAKGLLCQERNKVRETLRTSGYPTYDGQVEWYATINKPESSIWYWEFMDEVECKSEIGINTYMKGVTVGVGGLVNIDRWNRSAELAVLVFEEYRHKGYGRRIIDWLITEAFNNQNMHKVWAEVYECNPNREFWEELGGGWVRSFIPDQKYWEGEYFGSDIYTIING